MRSRSEDDLLLVMRKEDVKLVDVWDVNGLRGTGSFNFEVDDLFVPEYYTFDWGAPPWDDGPLYAMPMTLIFCVGVRVRGAGGGESGTGCSHRDRVYKEAGARGCVITREGDVPTGFRPGGGDMAVGEGVFI